MTITSQFKKVYPTWDELYRHNDVFSLPWVSSDVKPELMEVIDGLKTDSRYALDVGCGYGQVSRYLAKRGFQVTAIDISQAVIKQARNASETTRNICYKVSDSLAFNAPQRFDVIIDFLHIHDVNIDDLKKYLTNLKNQLKKQGELIIATFKNNDLNSGNIFSRKSYFVDQDIYYYSIEDIHKNIGFQDFEIINVKDFCAGNSIMQIYSYIVHFRMI